MIAAYGLDVFAQSLRGEDGLRVWFLLIDRTRFTTPSRYETPFKSLAQLTISIWIEPIIILTPIGSRSMPESSELCRFDSWMQLHGLDAGWTFLMDGTFWMLDCSYHMDGSMDEMDDFLLLDTSSFGLSLCVREDTNRFGRGIMR